MTRYSLLVQSGARGNVVRQSRLIAILLIVASGCGANRGPMTRLGCSERLETALKSDEMIELKLMDDTRVRGSFHAVTSDSLMLEHGEVPATRESFSLEHVSSVSYSRKGFQPSFMVAGLFCGMVVGGLIHQLIGDEPPPCSEPLCGLDGVESAMTGGLIGLGVGTVLAGALPKQYEIVCNPQQRSGRGVTR